MAHLNFTDFYQVPNLKFDIKKLRLDLDSILKKKGFYDYVSEILSPDKREEGVRLDTEHNYPLTVTAKSINCVNVMSLIAQIKMLGYIKKDIS